MRQILSKMPDEQVLEQLDITSPYNWLKRNQFTELLGNHNCPNCFGGLIILPSFE